MCFLRIIYSLLNTQTEELVCIQMRQFEQILLLKEHAHGGVDG